MEISRSNIQKIFKEPHKIRVKRTEELEVLSDKYGIYPEFPKPIKVCDIIFPYGKDEIDGHPVYPDGTWYFRLIYIEKAKYQPQKILDCLNAIKEINKWLANAIREVEDGYKEICKQQQSAMDELDAELTLATLGSES
jgi:hypothetical protein